MENVYSFLGPDMESVAEIQRDRLYFVTFSQQNFTVPNNRAPPHFFSIDDVFVYRNFFSDFGPLNLGHLFRYWQVMNEKLKSPSLHGKKIVHWTTIDYRKRANAAFLIGSYAVIQLKMMPREVYRLLLNLKHPFVPFQDAANGISLYKIKLIDCFNAVYKACYYGIIKFDDFDLDAYEFYEKVENGDLNWIVPDKLLAISGPMPTSEFGCTPEHYISYFRKNNVKAVIRCNKPVYLSSRFTEHGINVYELFFSDGSVPAKAIVYKFLSTVEESPSAIAVHCKAGLGRTGCLIGAFLIKHYKMTAHEAIAWLRICRPGSVIGHQQSWLERCESYLHRSGELYRLRNFGEINKMPLHQYGIYSIREQAAIKNHVFPTVSPEQKMKKKQSYVTAGASAVGVGITRIVASLRRPNQDDEEDEWPSQGEALRAKKWEYQGKANKKVTFAKLPSKASVSE